MPATKKKPAPSQTNFIAEQDKAMEQQHKHLEAGDLVRENYKLVRIQFGRLPNERKLDDSQKRLLADQLGADMDSLSASRKLWNAREPAIKKFRAVLQRIEALKTDPWYTLPHPEQGFRLIRNDKVAEFDQKIEAAKIELHREAVALQAEMPTIIERRRKELGAAFNVEDYNFSAADVAYIQVRYHEATVPDYLMKLAPEVAAREATAIREEFAQVARIKEAAMAEELFKVIDKLSERLNGRNDDNSKKIFRDDSVKQLFDAIEEAEFQLKTNAIGGGELKNAFTSLRAAIGNQRAETLPSALRSSEGFRDDMRQRLEKVGENLLSLAVLKPRRSLIRNRATSAAFQKGVTGAD